MLHSIKHGFRQLIVVGDRVLIKPEQPEDRTDVGLYLPQTVVEKEKVQSGRIVATGPGIAMPEFTDEDEEPWKQPGRKTRYIPMQAEEGDYALFLKKAAVEIKFEGEEYLVVPQGAILLLLRDTDEPHASE
jgi:chaperonin GroES